MHTLLLFPSSGSHDRSHKVTCSLTGWSKNNHDAIWVKWNNIDLCPEVSQESRLDVMSPSYGPPGQKVAVQIFNKSNPISEIAYFTYLPETSREPKHLSNNNNSSSKRSIPVEQEESDEGKKFYLLNF